MKNNVKLDKIIKAILEVTEINIKTIKGRKQDVADAKKIYFHIVKHRTKITLTESSKYLNMSHCSGVHNYKKCKDLLEYDEIFKKTYNKVFRKVSFSHTKQDLRDLAAKNLKEYRALKIQIEKFDEIDRLKLQKAEALKILDVIENNLKKAS